MNLIKTKVLEVHDKFVVCENADSLWFLGGRTFNLPRDEALKGVKVGDIVEIKINPIED